MKSNPHPTALVTHWSISMGYRALCWLLCHFVITGNGTEEYRSVFTPDWFLTPVMWLVSHKPAKAVSWCYSADLFACPLEPGLCSAGRRRLLSHSFREWSKTGI